MAGWFVAGFEDVEGTRPRLAEPGELADVLRTVGQLAEVLTPSPLPDVPTIEAELATAFAGWRGFAESGAPADLDEWSARNLDRLAELETGWSVSAPGGDVAARGFEPGEHGAAGEW